MLAQACACGCECKFQRWLYGARSFATLTQKMGMHFSEGRPAIFRVGKSQLGVHLSEGMRQG